ncbi:MAG: magnesium-translocating P-type ATPase [Veillonellaceae bacterium]|nr:magnesium-translocating P-type ATPase [Veillonellaceae bacterium]
MQISDPLVRLARIDAVRGLSALESGVDGLSTAEAALRLKQYGPNEIAQEKKKSALVRMLDNVKNPLVVLLTVLAAVSFATGDMRATIVIMVMVVLGVVLRFYQEMRADDAAEKLKAMVGTKSTVVREGEELEVPLHDLVPGDVVRLSAGDMVPGDMRVLSAKDLFINQSALTGESIPVEKIAAVSAADVENPLELPNICFLGSNVESGSATAVVIHTGDRTYFGALAASIVGEREMTSFDLGVNKFTWLMIRFIGVMVPAVFVINGLSRHDWVEAFLFALAVAVGLTPEMLPMIVTVNLSKGAIAMAVKKVIVKRLNSIQNIGAMDVLCTDKTGTITEGRIVLEKHMDVNGLDSERVLQYGYLNSYFHTGLKNLMDEAILDYGHLEEDLKVKTAYRKIDEIPFDFNRRRMSVILEDQQNQHILICKGAVEEITNLSTTVEIEGKALSVQPDYAAQRKQLVNELNAKGFRVVAIAYKVMPAGDSDEPHYEVSDEKDLTLLGYLAFLDPPKESALEALKRLRDLKVEVKILTGDNDIVTTYICGKVGMPVEPILLGSQIEAMSDTQLSAAVIATRIFAKLAPAQKERIVRTLQKNGSVVGFMGDGINDAPALKAADVGISVNSAVDIAKESSDIILLENDLLVLEQGVREGRRVFGNILKYIKMAASSNFGNMFSVVGASAFLPFLPMLPVQVLINNLLYDFSQVPIPTDEVDAEWLVKPRKWEIGNLRRFILFIGPISSIFDYATFFIMLYVFNCWNNPALFHTGWFVESLFTQTLIIHIIRTNKIPFLQSWASRPLILGSLVIVTVGAWLTVSPLSDMLGFVALPTMFWLLLAIMLACYIALTQLVKNWFVARYPE